MLIITLPCSTVQLRLMYAQKRTRKSIAISLKHVSMHRNSTWDFLSGDIWAVVTIIMKQRPRTAHERSSKSSLILTYSSTTAPTRPNPPTQSHPLAIHCTTAPNPCNPCLTPSPPTLHSKNPQPPTAQLQNNPYRLGLFASDSLAWSPSMQSHCGAKA